MEGQKDFLGEEESARQQRLKHDRLSAGVGGGVFFITLIIQTLFSKAAVEFLDKLSAVFGSMRAWIIAALIGVVVFCILKIYLFFSACCKDSVFSRWRSLKITARHYMRVSVAHPYLLLSVGCYSSMLAVFFWILSKQNGKPFPVCMFIITAAALNLSAILLYKSILRFARTSQSNLGQVLLKKTHPGIKWKKTGTLNPNKLINDKLLTLKDVDLICVAAVHFSHLMRNVELLKTIRTNNPKAAIYYMPQFSYSWHILERAAELEYFYRKGYLGPLIRAIYNACEHLKANVMLRHNPAEFRLTAWVKFIHGENNKSPRNDVDNMAAGIQPAEIEWGGFFAQQYIYGQEGYESPYLSVSQDEWCGALAYLIGWFFENWRDNCSPIQIAEVVKKEEYMSRVAKDIGYPQRKINRLRNTGDLAVHLENNDNLKELYIGIGKGDL